MPVLNAESDHTTQVSNIINCLEFLADEALDLDCVKVNTIIRQAITDIANASQFCPSQTAKSSYLDLLRGFKFFARFCLIEDPLAREEVIQLMNTIDHEILKRYAERHHA